MSPKPLNDKTLTILRRDWLPEHRMDISVGEFFATLEAQRAEAIAARDAELRAAIKGLSEASPAGYHRTVDVHAILALLDQPVVPMSPPLGGTPGGWRVSAICRDSLDPDAHEWVKVRRNGLVVSVYCERCDVTPIELLEASPILSAEPPEVLAPAPAREGDGS